MMNIVFLLLALATVALGEVKFPIQKIKFGNRTISVEVATTDEQRAHGLMFRKSLPVDQGMLFVFPDEAPRHFWMKNTFIPLSIGFFDKNRVLLKIMDMDPTKTVLDPDPPKYFSEVSATYALEMNRGWFKKNKIKIGQKFEFVKPRSGQ